MDNTLKLTDTYWEMLKSLNDDIKLRLATRLTASVIAGKNTSRNRTNEMIEKHLGKWEDEMKCRSYHRGYICRTK